MKKVKSRQPAAKVTRQAARAASPARAKRPAKPRPSPKRTKKVVVAKTAKGAKRAKAVVSKPKPLQPALKIRELDPLRVCGDRTSVVQLFRVDEELIGGRVAGARQVHLVFNDRHGWYCEHGRSCHAVSAVMRHARIR